MDQSFPKSKRIKSSRQFTFVLRRGGCAADDCLVVFATRCRSNAEKAPNSDQAQVKKRLGITIPKKTGNAVVRNQWKRWIREAFRTQQERIPDGFDYVVRPKKGALGNWTKIRASMGQLPSRAVKRIRSS